MWETILGGGLAVAIIETIKVIILRIIDAVVAKNGKRKTDADRKIEALESKIGALEIGQRVMLRERIRFLCKVHIEAGEISYSDREDLIAMHGAFHGLGGNGNLDMEMNKIAELPLKELGGKNHE